MLVGPGAVGPRARAGRWRPRGASGVGRPGGPAKTARPAGGFPRETPNRLRTAIYHLCAATATAHRACAAARARTARCRSARRSHLMSGWRRAMPEAVHGTSARMRSYGSPSHHAAGSPASPHTTLRREAQPREIRAHPLEPLRVRVERGHARRRPARACASVLPPGAAHASSTRCPSASVEKRRRELRRRVLHRHQAFGESRDALGGQRRFQQHRALADQRRRHARAPRAGARYSAGVARRRFTRSVSGGCWLPASSTLS